MLRTTMLRTAAIAILLTLHAALPAAALAATPTDATNAPWSLNDLAGQTHQPLDEPSTRAIALVFITPDCPIANFYQPTLRKLGEEFAGRGIPLFMIHSDPEVTADAAQRHVEKFKIAAPVILDRDQSIARRVDAKVTPEAIIVDRAGEILYRGRIDNFYEALGRKRRAATEHDFRDALAAVADGRQVANPVTKALGCHIPFTDKNREGEAPAEPRAR
jgi:thiol-disulfide isomerase/thioredoxin